MCQFSSAQGLGPDMTYPWGLITTTVLFPWIRAAGRRYIYATARGERFVEEDSRCVKHRGILRRYHGDRRTGEDSKESEHGAGVVWKEISY
jgi:hypothetical protein